MHPGSLGLAASLAALAAGLAGCALLQGGEPAPAPVASEARPGGFVAAYRRLTESQYRHSIADVFGADIQLNARFEPERREERLQSVGNARQSITTSGLEQYYSMARSIAEQVMASERRDAIIGCTPAGAADAACAEQFIRQTGEKLFRRPVSAAEAAQFKAMWAETATETGDFHAGLKAAMVGLLMSPEFLFRLERAEADPAQRDGFRLDGYSKAARLSFMLWDTGPDAELMDAARSGALHTDAGLKAQVERLLASPRLEDGVRALFSDVLQFEYFDTLSKDGDTYPKFSQAVATSAREETLRFLVDHLVNQRGDYRDIFTRNDTFIDRSLAYVYNVPYLSNETWSAYRFSEDSDRSGILTQITFLSLFSHPGASSPTVRGVKLQEIFRCLEVPQPPPDVDFSKVQALEHGTVRVRLTEHMTNPGCAGCHLLTDPAGLAMERFDGLGQYRTLENGEPIDVVSELEGQRISGARGVGQFLRNDPETPACFAQNLYYYGVARPYDEADIDDIDRLKAAFAAGGYRLPDLYRSLLTDPAFYRVPSPNSPPAATITARLGEREHQEVAHGQSF